MICAVHHDDALHAKASPIPAADKSANTGAAIKGAQQAAHPATTSAAAPAVLTAPLGRLCSLAGLDVTSSGGRLAAAPVYPLTPLMTTP